MRTIIAGSRDITSPFIVGQAIKACGWTPTVVISGAARGVDRLGEDWAKIHNVPIERFPAEWSRLGKSAGYIRNQKMAEEADALIAIWDGVSKGTKHMIDIATAKGLKIYVHVTRPPEPWKHPELYIP